MYTVVHIAADAPQKTFARDQYHNEQQHILDSRREQAWYLRQLCNFVIQHGLAVAQLLYEAVDLGILLLQLVAYTATRKFQLLSQRRYLRDNAGFHQQTSAPLLSAMQPARPRSVSNTTSWQPATMCQKVGAIICTGCSPSQGKFCHLLVHHRQYLQQPALGRLWVSSNPLTAYAFLPEMHSTWSRCSSIMPQSRPCRRPVRFMVARHAGWLAGQLCRVGTWFACALLDSCWTAIATCL